MTIVTTTAICLAVLCSMLLGRCGYISSRRASKLDKQHREIKLLKHRLDYIADSSKYDRYYEVEEDELKDAYNVNMKVYVRISSCGNVDIDTCCYCLVKAFPFADDKEFALLEANELLDKLNEK